MKTAREMMHIHEEIIKNIEDTGDIFRYKITNKATLTAVMQLLNRLRNKKIENRSFLGLIHCKKMLENRYGMSQIHPGFQEKFFSVNYSG